MTTIRLQCVLQKRDYRHGAYSARDRGYIRSFGYQVLEICIANQFAVYSIDSNIYDNRTLLDHICSQQIRTPSRNDDDIRCEADRLQVPRLGMTDSDGSVS